KLELSRIECRRGLSRIGPENVYVGNVELVNQVEHVDCAFEFEPFSQVEQTADTEIREDRRWLDSCVALQVPIQSAIQVAGWLQESCGREPRCNRHIRTEVRWRIRRHHQRTIGVWTEIEVAIGSNQDVKRPSGTGFHNRSYCEVAEQLADPIVANSPRLIHTAEHKAMTLIEHRFRASRIGIEAVLRRQQRLEIGRVVDHM